MRTDNRVGERDGGRSFSRFDVAVESIGAGALDVPPGFLHVPEDDGRQ